MSTLMLFWSLLWNLDVIFVVVVIVFLVAVATVVYF